MCAGAGGKTLALSAIMRNRGELVATDISPSRLKELQKRMRRAGAGNIRVRERFLQEEHEEQFDLVFVDAPCTGTGTLRRNPGMKWTVTAAMVAELSKKQQEILRKAAGYVKPGGTLLYATCSLFRDENETVVGEFLGSNSGFALEDPAPRVERLGLTDAIEERFVKLLPHVHNTDGFFCAFLKRTDAVPPPA
jgi:16S rRNA (cytosine967-C5)-methyltransferase